MLIYIFLTLSDVFLYIVSITNPENVCNNSNIGFDGLGHLKGHVEGLPGYSDLEDFAGFLKKVYWALSGSYNPLCSNGVHVSVVDMCIINVLKNIKWIVSYR